MEHKEFEDLVIRAISELPVDFKDRLENVDVVIENEPDMEMAKEFKLGSKGRLLGLYQGISLKSRTHYYGMVMPDKITIFKTNIERVCRLQNLDIYNEIKHVVQHEIAHHFGISDKRLRDLGTY